MSINALTSYGTVALESTETLVAPVKDRSVKDVYESAQVAALETAVEVEFDVASEELDFDVESIALVRGTYSVHAEVLLSVPDFYESAFAKKQPWQDHNTNFGTTLGVSGHYRSLFSTKGNYRNFYEIFTMSTAKSYFQNQSVPSFYSDEGNCDETTYNPPIKGKDYESYKPFAVESRGYTRAYFYGVSK